MAARAAGLQAIDGPYLEIRDDAGLRLRAGHARALGFDGKWAVHPGQLAIINEAFTPTADEIARARAILDALDASRGPRRGRARRRDARRGQPQARPAGHRARPSGRAGKGAA